MADDGDGVGESAQHVRREDEQEERGQGERGTLRSDKQLGDKGTSQGRQRMPPSSGCYGSLPDMRLNNLDQSIGHVANLIIALPFNHHPQERFGSGVPHQDTSAAIEALFTVANGLLQL